jgi:hypothetical protein
VDVLPRRKSLKEAGMMDPDVTMSREEIAAFLASRLAAAGAIDNRPQGV